MDDFSSEFSNIEENPEVWLRFLMAHMGNEEDKQNLINHVSAKSGVSPEKVEQAFHALAEYLVMVSRAN